jgi:hypothetical protein
MKTQKTLKLKFPVILSLVLVLSITSVTGQSSDENNLKFGIKGGLNISNMYTKDVQDHNTLMGFHAGLFLKMPITSVLAFQPELIYTMKGSELTYNSFISGKASFSLNYIEMPLLAVINLSENININGGLYVATLTRVKITNQSNVALFNFENELEKSDFEMIDYGLVLGTGLDFKKISIGLRYEYGMKPVGKERLFLGQSYRFPDARNSTLQVYLSISIL